MTRQGTLNAASPPDVRRCTCRRPVKWIHSGGRIECVRCRGVVRLPEQEGEHG